MDNSLTTYTADEGSLGDGKAPVPPCIVRIGGNRTQVSWAGGLPSSPHALFAPGAFGADAPAAPAACPRCSLPPPLMAAAPHTAGGPGDRRPRQDAHGGARVGRLRARAGRYSGGAVQQGGAAGRNCKGGVGVRCREEQRRCAAGVVLSGRGLLVRVGPRKIPVCSTLPHPPPPPPRRCAAAAADQERHQQPARQRGAAGAPAGRAE